MNKPPSQSRGRNIREPPASQSNVDIKTVTWNKDSHGLFDYENSTYDMKKFTLVAPSRFYRLENSIQMTALDAPVPENAERGEFLLCISNDRANPDQFVIDVNALTQEGRRSSFSPFLIVRSLKCPDGKNQRGFALKAGDVVKLGRIEFRLLEVCNRTGMIPSKIDYRLYQQDSIFNIETQNVKPTDGEGLCRFCFSDNFESPDEIDNILLFMCNCKGSSGGLHFACLKTWINYKTVNKNQYNNILTYQLRKLECDVCLAPYPRRVSYKGEVYEFLSIVKPTTPYLILERVMQDMVDTSNISIISLEDKQEVKIGRGHLCDLRVSDISVSRVHAMLKFTNENFMLFDNDSKFGTLIQLDQNYPVRTEKAAIQVGRSVFTFVMKNTLAR